jgi:hypothetical protein
MILSKMVIIERSVGQNPDFHGLHVSEVAWPGVVASIGKSARWRSFQSSRGGFEFRVDHRQLPTRCHRSKITLVSISEGAFAQEFLLESKADSVANCFHKRSASLLTRAGTWMETPT